MHKLTLVIASLFFITTAEANNACTPLNDRYLSVPSISGGYLFGIDLIYWRFSMPALDLTLAYPSEFENGKFTNAILDYRGGYRASIGYIFPCTGYTAMLVNTHANHFYTRILDGSSDFNTSATLLFRDRFTLPDNIGITGIPVPILKIYKRPSYEYNTWDLEFGQQINIITCIKMKLFAGLRYTDFTETVNAIYKGSNSISSVIDDTHAINTVDARLEITQKDEFLGIGPRFGVNATYPIGAGFNIEAEISTALLISKNQSDYDNELIDTEITQVFDADNLIIAASVVKEESIFSLKRPRRQRIVPNIDSKLGVNFIYQFCNLAQTRFKLECGWMQVQYFNCFDQFSDVNLVAPEFQTSHTVGCSFDGLYLGLELKI